MPNETQVVRPPVFIEGQSNRQVVHGLGQIHAHIGAEATMNEPSLTLAPKGGNVGGQGRQMG
ncbi:hypothetical protein D3C85_1826250 [compost metagenome]